MSAPLPPRFFNRAAGSLERMNAFSDGVFSIAITLLLLELRVPAPSAEHGLLASLWEERIEFAALGITFALMGVYWVGHTAMIRLVREGDRILLWLNLLFLLFVAIVPFSARLLTAYVGGADQSDARVAISVYCANLILAGLALDLVWRRASGGMRLVDPALPRNAVWMVHVRVLTGPVVYALAIALAWLVSARASLALLVLTPLLYVFPLVFDRMERWHAEHPDA